MGGPGHAGRRCVTFRNLPTLTQAHAIVTGLLIGFYAGLVLLATRVLTFHTPVAMATSTLAAAALFNPVRVRVQHAVDRRFNRAV